MENNKKEYIVPQLMVDCYKSEMGYANSSIVNTMIIWENGFDQLEQYEERSGWGSSSEDNHFWN